MNTYAGPTSNGLIGLSFMAALILTAMPLPEWLRPFRPDWVAMVLIYWCLVLPSRINVGIGWLMGLLVDVLTASLLGQHAMALAVVAFITVNIHLQIRVYPIWQQALSVFVLIALSQLLVIWVKGMIGAAPQTWLYWSSSMVSAFVWPALFILLRNMRHQFRVK